MTFEINDKARGARKNITLPSYTSLDTLKDKVAQVLNLHPGSLQLQYRFSNEKSNVLPFDLVSIEDYHDMCDRLRCLVGPKILASGKPSKTPRKLVTVQLFNKSMEGILASGEKSIKVSNMCFDSGNLSISIDCRSLRKLLVMSTLPQRSMMNFLRRRKWLSRNLQTTGAATYILFQISPPYAGNQLSNDRMVIVIQSLSRISIFGLPVS